MTNNIRLILFTAYLVILAAQSLLNEGLADEFWFFVNPIILGKGMPLFKDLPDTIKLKLVESRTFACGVIALHYEKV